MAQTGKFIGGIRFDVGVGTAKLASDMKRARGMTNSFVGDVKKRLGGLRDSFTGVGTALTAAFSVGAVTTFAKRQFDMIDALHDTAKNLGITTEGLSRLNFAAEQSGASQEVVEKALAKMVKSTRDASLGLDTYLRAYNKLGLNAKELMQLAPEKQFATIAEAIKNLKNENEQLTVAQDIFGRGGKELVETLRLGKDGLAGMANEADRLGATINSFDAAKVAKAADEINKLKKELAGIGNQLAVDFGPGAVGFAQRVSTGLSRLTGGEGGENVAERQLRQRTELMVARNQNIAAESQRRFELKQMRQRYSNRGLLTHDQYVARRKQQLSQGQAVVDAMKGALGAGSGFAKGLGATVSQIATGIATSSEARYARQNAMKQIMDNSFFTGGPKASDKTWEKTKARQQMKVDRFSAAESGSVAAHQQRVRGMQQFDKVQLEQRDLLKQIAANTKNSGANLAPANTSGKA